MLGFIISTLAFSYAAFLLNRTLNKRQVGKTLSRNFLVAVFATLVSMGVGWLVDEIDGDADLPQKKASLSEAIHSGDVSLIAGKIIGIY